MRQKWKNKRFYIHANDKKTKSWRHGVIKWRMSLFFNIIYLGIGYPHIPNYT